MKSVAIQNNQTALEPMSVEDLFDEAAKYGKITVFSDKSKSHPNCYKVDIDFQTREHTSMTSSSPRGLSVKAALIQAIRNAEDMVRVARGIGS